MPDEYDDLIDSLGSPAKKARPPLDYRVLYQDVGKKYGVDPDLLYNQAKQESVNFNPHYVYGPGKSPMGAAGLSQFMPDTARQYGLYVGKGRDDRYNPRLAADAQARMMKDLIAKHGDATLALAAYNSGHNKTSEQARRSAQRITETRGYVQKIAPKGDKYDQLLDGIGGTPQSAASQSDPYDALLDSLEAPAEKKPSPFARVKAGVGAAQVDDWRPQSMQSQKKLFETPRSSQQPRRSLLGDATTALPGVHQILRLLPEEDRENIVEGVTGAMAGTARQVANTQELGMQATGLRAMGVPNPVSPRIRQLGTAMEQEVAENEAARPAPTTFAGNVRRGVGRGVGASAVELPKLILGGTVLKAANLPAQGALARADEGYSGLAKGAAGGLVYHYGGQLTGKAFSGLSPYLAKIGNSLVWIAGPVAEHQLVAKAAGSEAPNLAQSIGENIPFGIMAGMGARGKVRVKMPRGERDATTADLPKILKKELEVVPPERMEDARQTEPQRQGVSPEQPVEATPVRSERADVLGSEPASVPESVPQRFYHTQYGNVVKAADQTGARKGKTKIYVEGNPEEIHYPKTVDLRERGNERVVPLKESAEVPPEAVPAEKPQQPSEMKGATVAPPSPETVRPDVNELRQYGQSLVGENRGIKGVKLIGSTAAKGEGRDVDVLYDLGDVKLPKDEGAATERIIEILERHDNLRPVGEFDVFAKAGDRYFYQAKGAGVSWVENSEYGRQQASKPSLDLVKSAEPETVRVEPEAEGMVRLYRADPATATEPQGKGWANDPEYVSKKYGAGQMDSETIWYIDVPKKTLDAEYGDYRSASVIDSDTLRTLGVSVEPKLLRRSKPETTSVEQGVELKTIKGDEAKTPQLSATESRKVDRPAIAGEEKQWRKVYHGSDQPRDVTQLKAGTAGDVEGVYFTEDPAAAMKWGQTASAKAVGRNLSTQELNQLPSHVNEAEVLLRNPASYNDVRDAKRTLGREWTKKSLTDELKRRGFDGVIDDSYQSNEIIVFDKSQIRARSSETNAVPPIVYHGTKGEFAGFDSSRLGSSTGMESAKGGFFFVGNPEATTNYAKGGRVVSAKVEIRNPKVVEFEQREQYDGIPDMIAKAKAEGRDGLILRNWNEGGPKNSFVETDIFIPFDAKQIKQVSEQPIKEASNVVKEAEVSESTSSIEAERLGAGVQGAPARETAPAPSKEPSTTSARKAQMADDRAALDLPELPQAERKSWQATLDKAKERGTKNASVLADEVLAKPRSLNEVETAQLVLRAQEIKNDHARVMEEIGNEKNSESIQAKRAEVEALEREFDKLTQATKASGTEKGRALASQKLTINQDYDLVSLVQRAKAAKGRDLTPEERTRYEGMAKEIESLTERLGKAEEQLTSKQLQRDIDRVVRRGKRAETKKELDDEFVLLSSQFAQARAQTKGIHSAGIAGLDPEGTLTPLIAKMARNRVRAGVVKAEDVVDHVYEAVSQHVPGITKRDIRDAISGYGLERKGKPRADDVKKLARIKSELKKLSAQEDIEAGKRLTAAEKTRQTNLLKQEADLTRRLAEKDFNRPERRTLVYNKETQSLVNRVDRLKGEYERELYKAQRGKLGVAWDVGVNIANVPKSLKSMGDVSAVLRQGGYFSLTHPVLSTKAGLDMLRSFSDTGFKNVEREIQAHRDFDLARRSGVEFTGMEKDNPNLSKREEAFLGADIIDRVSEIPVAGKAVTPVKAVKDFSERTFVSFLDSQRMQVFSRFADHVRSLKMSPKEETRALKAMAQFVNIGTGRGSLGRRGNQIAPALNTLMFSPRLLASRVQLMNKMVNPVAIARMPKGARSQIIKDNVKFAGTIATALGLAQAAGAGVSLDPDDADFLKIRIGDTRYDILTGLQQPMRFIYRMARALQADVTGSETYAGEKKSALVERFARSKASPVAGGVADYITGEDFKGRKFKLSRQLVDLVTPLYLSDFREAMEEDGVVGALVKTSPALVGVGAQTYKDAPEKPRTHAEKLARKFVRAKMPDNAREEEQITIDQAKADLKAKSRRGEDVTKELSALGATITDRQAKNIINARDKTRLQEDVNRLSAKDAIIVWSVMNSGQQRETRSLLEHKATLIDNLPEAQQGDVRRRYADAGIEAKSKKKASAGFKKAFNRTQFATQ